VYKKHTYINNNANKILIEALHHKATNPVTKIVEYAIYARQKKESGTT